MKRSLSLPRDDAWNHGGGQHDSGHLQARVQCGIFSIAYALPPRLVYRACLIDQTNILNAELSKKALEKVGNPNVLVNLVSRRVRQLNSGAGAISRPLIDAGPNMGVADIALTEIIEDKIGFEMPELVELPRPTAKKRATKR